MKQKHTPGPWVAYDDEGSTWLGDAAGRVSPIADLTGTSAPDRGLIVEAPAMLQALRDAEKCLGYFLSTRNQPEREAIRAILARLDGI